MVKNDTTYLKCYQGQFAFKGVFHYCRCTHQSYYNEVLNA